MKTLAALLLCTALAPASAFAQTTLDDVLTQLDVSAERDGASARIPSISVTSGDVTISMSDVVATESGSVVNLSTEQSVVITKTLFDDTTQTYTISSPDAVVQISELTDTTIVASLNATHVNIKGTGYADTSLDVENVAWTVDADSALSADSHLHMYHSGGEFSARRADEDTQGIFGDLNLDLAVTNPSVPYETDQNLMSSVKQGFRATLSADSTGIEGTTKSAGRGLSVMTSADPWDLRAYINDEDATLTLRGDGGRVTFADNGAGYAYGEYTASVSFPTTLGDEKPFTIRADTGEITLNDAAWGILGTAAEGLSRAPLMGKLNLSGIISDVTDLATPIASLRSFSIDTFDLSGLGARISALGDVQISPMGDLMDGEITVNLDGIQGLVDLLKNAKIISAENAAAAMMPIALFTKPVGDDQSSLAITFKDGTVSLNGNRIR